jgi:SagB-type dehydrogenase family enzyme
LFRRAPFLISYWDSRQLIFENYASGVRLSADPLASTILDFFDNWRSTDNLAAHLTDYTPASLRAVVGSLERFTLLQRSDRPAPTRLTAMASWGRWNPAAAFFHFSTKDVRFYRDEAAVDRLLRQKARVSPPPPSVKRYRSVRRVNLPTIPVEGEFPEALLARRTWRRFSRRPVSLADLSLLLGLTWRVQSWFDIPGLPSLPAKTSPSGGARHSIEVYVLARRVDRLPPGLYHYGADRHRLELIKAGASASQITSYLPSQSWFGSAAALMVMTSVFPRVQWKYDFSRAYRMVLAEAGHFCQTFCLTATWLGLAPFCTMSLADSKIEQDLGIDGVTESVLYIAGVGTRPRDGRLE